MNCKNCKWLYDPEMSSVCVNDKSENCADFVLPNDGCSQFEINDHTGGVTNMVKTEVKND